MGATIQTLTDAELLMKRLQIGVGGRDALDNAHGLMAEAYGTIGALLHERAALLRGEFICKTCGLRKDSDTCEREIPF